MKIHNWYSDLLLSSTFFLNNIILKDLPINTFQFNIGNSSFQLNYNPNFKLPAAIVNFESSRPSNNRPNIFQFNNRSNINIIPVLHNNNRDVTLELQEEHFIINFSVNINCESQLQALEIKHLIESFVPLGKYLHLYEFTSFFNIDDQLLIPCLFDVNSHRIDNLFLRHNKFTDKIDYSFSVQYDPLLKINDLNLNLGDTNETSFQVAVSFEALTPIPYFLLFPKLDTRKFQINKSNINIPIDNKDYILLTILNTSNQDFISNIVLSIDDELTTRSFSFKDNDNNIINSTLNYKFDQEIQDLFLSGIIDNSVFKSKAKVIKNIETSTFLGEILDSSNNIIGTFSDILFDNVNSKITAWFKTKINNKDIDNRFTFDFDLLKTRKTVKTVVFSSSNNSYILYLFNNIVSKDAYSVIKDINKTKTIINLSKTTIIGYRLNDQTEFLFDTPISIQSDGFFHDIKVSGIINSETGIISDLNHSINNLDQLIFSFVFDYQPCGDSLIERITLDFRVKNETISNISPITLKDYSSTLKNFLIDEIIAYEVESNMFMFKINVDNVNIHKKNFYWKFLFFNDIVTDSDRTEILLDKQKSNSRILSFSTTETFFKKHLDNISNINPLLFEVF